MKLPGWIKSAVEFVKIPAIARQAGPPSNAPHEPDSGVPTHDTSLNDSEVRPDSAVESVKTSPVAWPARPPRNAPHEPDGGVPPRDASLNDSEVQPASAVDVAPEVEVSIEDESRLGVGSDGPIAAEPESPISVESESLVSPELEVSPGQQEVDRRRGIVRAFFNDYWSSVDDKPASFAERLDLAEGYINERVAAGGEAWRLGPATRKQLGLPPSKNA